MADQGKWVQRQEAAADLRIDLVLGWVDTVKAADVAVEFRALALVKIADALEEAATMVRQAEWEMWG